MRVILLLALNVVPQLARAEEVGVNPPSSARAFCRADLSEVAMPQSGGPFVLPEHFEQRALRPGLLRAQQAVCRCLPRRRRHHPQQVGATLHIVPEEGTVSIRYEVLRPGGRPGDRMRACLQTHVLLVEPMSYTSDIRTPYGPVRETLVYPLRFDLR